MWLDLRLVPVAATVWMATLLAPHLPPAPLVGVALGGSAIAGLLAARSRSSVAAVTAAVLTALAATAVCAAVREAALNGSPVREAARPGRSLDLVVELDGDPRPVSGTVARRVVVAATVREVHEPDRLVATHDHVVLFAAADPWERLVSGQTVRVRASAGAAPAGSGVAALVSARGPPTVVGRPSWVQRAAESIRTGLGASARRVLPDDPAGLLPGLVVGDTRSLDPVLAEDFRTAGLTHLVAVSGANVAIVLTGVVWPLRRRALDRRLQAVVAVLALIGFVVLAGPSASVLRAAAMGAVGLLALASGRPRAAVPALSGAAIVLLLLDPVLATDAGFALSVAATAAIVLLAPRWSRLLRARRLPGLLADALAVSAAAGVVTAPLIAALSGQVSLVSLPANLLAAPAVAPATVLGLAAALLARVAPPVADVVVWMAGWPVRWLVLVAHRASGVPDGVAAWPAGTTGAVFLTLLLMAGAFVLWRSPRARLAALAALVGVLLIGWPARQAVRGWPPTDTDLVACDVGQGDALVVPTAPGQAVVVDVGPDVGAVDRCLQRLGVHDVPLLVLSHLDADHATGLAGAFSGRHVGQVGTGTLSPSDHRVGRIDAQARRAGAGRVTLTPGYRRTIGTATIEVLAPPPEIATASASPNDLCLLVRVTQRGVRILLTGDLSAEAERRILDRGVDLRADVLKVPHHGSADTDARFLSATGARVALVSVGLDNPYGHPAARTLTLLVRDGMQLHRTDREGDLAVVGSARGWGVAGRGGSATTAAGRDRGSGPAVVPASAPVVGERRRSVAACRGGSRTSRSDVPAARRAR